MGPLRAGLNSAWVMVTSADKRHTNPNKIPIYVYSDRAKQTTIPFHPNSALPNFTGLTNTGTFVYEMASSINLTLEIKMAKAKATTTTKAKALMTKRVTYVLKSLSDRGIVPSKVTQTLTSTGSSTNLTVIAKFKK
jgi:hypothetical protein